MKPIAFRVAGGVFTLRLVPTLMTLVMVALLLWLGFWQIDRLHQKTALIKEMKERMQEPEIDVGLSQIANETLSSLDYHPGKATGTFENDKPIYLNATRVDNGDGGYHVVVPLKLENGQFLMVDRGWIPYGLKDKPDGSGSENSLYRPVGSVHLTGVLRLPSPVKPPLRPENDQTKNIWYWVDLPAMENATGESNFLPFLLEADDAPHDGSYPIGGQARVDLPNHHFQYAMTWFWLAFILPVIYIAANWKRERGPITVKASMTD